ncbi:MAG: putative endonuclease, partial [Bacteroidia bacterium]
MKPIGMHNYFVYIITNKSKRVLYTGMSNSLTKRMSEHKEDALGAKRTFAGRYNCYYLLYWERFQYADKAYDREKEIKGWRRSKKIELIVSINPEWRFL